MTPKVKQTALSISINGLSFTKTAANVGVRDLGLRLTIDDAPVDVRYDAAGELAAEGVAGNALRVRTSVVLVEGLDAVVLTHQFTNTSGKPVRFTAATGLFAKSAAVLHGKGSRLGWDLRYVHTDNVRTERFPHCQMEYPYVRMLPAETTRLGGGEDQSFPALFIKDLKGKGGIVFAAATQALNYPVFTLRKGGKVNESIFDVFAIEHDPGQTLSATSSADPGRRFSRRRSTAPGTTACSATRPRNRSCLRPGSSPRTCRTSSGS
jgi:hypothetical protein